MILNSRVIDLCNTDYPFCRFFNVPIFVACNLFFDFLLELELAQLVFQSLVGYIELRTRVFQVVLLLFSWQQILDELLPEQPYVAVTPFGYIDFGW